MVVMEGSLSKWTNVMKGWQYRWFVLDDNSGLLTYYTVSTRPVIFFTRQHNHEKPLLASDIPFVNNSSGCNFIHSINQIVTLLAVISTNKNNIKRKCEHRTSALLYQLPWVVSLINQLDFICTRELGTVIIRICSKSSYDKLITTPKD